MWENTHNRSRKKESNPLQRTLTALLGIAILICLAVLGTIGWQYLYSSQQYDEVAENAILSDANDPGILSGMTVDWDYLRSINPDTVGWICMPGTDINYPIVQGSNDQQYLTEDFDGKSGGFVHKGCIFLSSSNDSDFSDSVNFIYGHNMNDSTMFGPIAKMKDDPDFKDNGVFYILTPHMNYRVSVYSVSCIDSTDTDILQPNFATQKDFKNYITGNLRNALHVNDQVDPTSSDKLFELVTCGDDFATTRVVVFGCVTESVVPNQDGRSDLESV